ncbi:MAG TPA: DNA-formamidopyrimidine glycosylase family protein [Nocardioides sp.]|uniref:DNA-formamidopyrimidine glycosylase family protein n=1 Tax=Nocardioides sp. TaxID=35761 RepID=UPI002E36AEAE|nr:DNA-formamidopyrimidine glycosylase family protein [Nocardioides sp.]HEX3929095.1 DNA-formamidopyrimidine glycosylase family protein [Nocardioides sp.]
MPEGDTVWRAARLLDRALSGRTLTLTDVRVPAYAAWDLSGGVVAETLSRGKHLLTRIDAERGWTLHTHLKMEGGWRVVAPGQRWPRPAHTARVVLATPEVVAIGFQLGLVEILAREEESRVVGHLGPDLLGPGWDPAEAVRRLLEQRDRPVKEALLDQTRLAGIGNMYANELCFLVGVDPLTPLDRIPDLHRLVVLAHELLEANRRRAVQSTTGDLRRGQNTWVYGRRGRRCRRCGTPIVETAIGDAGRARVTFHCPQCQRPG